MENKFEELYENGIYDYSDLVLTFSDEILLEEVTGYYQGEMLFLVTSDKHYGYVKTTFGSCSGCDELLACYGEKEKLNELAVMIRDNTRWFDDEDEAIHFFQTSEFLLEYVYGLDVEKFASDAIDILKERKTKTK